MTPFASILAAQDQQLLAARRRPLVGAIGPAVGGGALPIPTLAEALLGRVPLAACARTGFVCVGALGFIRTWNRCSSSLLHCTIYCVAVSAISRSCRWYLWPRADVGSTVYPLFRRSPSSQPRSHQLWLVRDAPYFLASCVACLTLLRYPCTATRCWAYKNR